MYLFVSISDLKKISEQQQAPVELDPYLKKLNNARRRVMLVNNILQNTHVRNYSTYCLGFHCSILTFQLYAVL